MELTEAEALGWGVCRTFGLQMKSHCLLQQDAACMFVGSLAESFPTVGLIVGPKNTRHFDK